MRGTLAIAVIACNTLLPVVAADVYVAPVGKPDHDGTKARPLDLATALSKKSPAKPGDTIWLLGGTYLGKFISKIAGEPERPITVRSYPGTWARIDSSFSDNRDNILHVVGGWTIFRDFEITSSDPRRSTRFSGSAPDDIKRGEAIHVLAPNVKLINLVVHDAALGIAAWIEAPDTEIYGCIIYHNGWQGPDRAHGHGIYSQNRIGRKIIQDNIIFNQFDKGIQIYGSSSAALRNYLIEGNVIFNSGIIAAESGLSENIVIYGGATGPEGIVLRDNMLYGTDFDGKLILGGTGAKDIVFEQNYVPQSVRLREWEQATITGNTWVRDSIFIDLHLRDALGPENYRWDRNRYFFWSGDSVPQPFQLQWPTASGSQHFARMPFKEWQNDTRFDQNSEFRSGRPQSSIFVRPNRYERGRAHVVVYNWNNYPHVEVDLRSAIPNGMPFEVLNAQNYFGPPVLDGVFDGSPVRLPMTGLSVAAPAGLPAPALTGPEFNVFVIRPAD